jgi:hypothetical protein
MVYRICMNRRICVFHYNIEGVITQMGCEDNSRVNDIHRLHFAMALANLWVQNRTTIC